jgi:beta-galactosidase
VPRAGDHNFIGGIYRDVHLVVTDPLHVTWFGTFVTTPHISKDSGTVNVKTEIQNQSAAAKNCTVKTTLLNPTGEVVANFSSTEKVEAGATVTFDQNSPVIPNPKPWSPDHPFLYTAVTTVSDETKAVDDYQTTFGFRWFKWMADQVFFLNGAHLYFHGADVHQDHAGWADATTDAGSYRDVKLIKDAGLDFIRGSHYPHHPAFADACDELGVLFWSENCFWAAGGAQKEGTWTASVYPINPADEAPFEQNVEDTCAMRFGFSAIIHPSSRGACATKFFSPPNRNCPRPKHC